jgi:hypothetical protein
MHYFQMEFQAHEHREELLREARERRLAQALESRRCNDGVLSQLHVRRLVGLLRREPGCEVGSEGFEEDGEATPCLAGRTKTAGTS